MHDTHSSDKTHSEKMLNYSFFTSSYQFILIFFMILSHTLVSISIDPIRPTRLDLECYLKVKITIAIVITHCDAPTGEEHLVHPSRSFNIFIFEIFQFKICFM